MRLKLFIPFSFFLFFTIANFYAEIITFNADRMEGNTGENTEYTKLIGNAHIKTETLEIAADEITLSGKDFRYISSTGNTKGINSEAGFDFTCYFMNYDRETKVALLEKNVNLIDKKNDVNAKAQIIEYKQETEIAIMQVDVSIVQKDNVCTAALAIYRKGDQILELTGNPKIERKKDIFRAQEIQLNIETEEISLDGKVRGTVVDETKSTETTSNNKTTPDGTAAKDETPKDAATKDKAKKSENSESTEDSEKQKSETDAPIIEQPSNTQAVIKKTVETGEQ